MHDPTKLEYKYLEPGAGPKFGVSSSTSTCFPHGTAYVYAWFCTQEHAFQFFQGRMGQVWDLEQGAIIKVTS